MTGYRRYFLSIIPRSRFRRFYVLVAFGLLVFLPIVYLFIQICSRHSDIPFEFTKIPPWNPQAHRLSEQSVFFLETTGKCQLSPRQACSVETAAHNHPDKKIIIYTLCENGTSVLAEGGMKPLKSNSKISVISLKLESFFRGSILQSWYNSRRWESSKFIINHLSDAIRFLLLWKHGGIYLDLDVIVLRPLTSLSNCFGLQEETLANGAVMIFGPYHPFLYACMVEYARTYDPWKWGYNGPELITRIAKKHCGWSSLSQWIKASCLNATLVPVHYFYAIPWESPMELFEVDMVENTLSKLAQSYVVHLWNKYSKSMKVILGSGSAMDILMKKNCPIIYENNIQIGEL